MPEIVHICFFLEVQNNHHWPLLLFFFCFVIMHNFVGSVVYAVIKGLPLLMPWSSYIDCYMMVFEEGRGSGEIRNILNPIMLLYAEFQ